MQFYQKNRKFITHTPRPPPTPVWREGTLREERERKPVISKKADGTGELQSLRRAAPPEPAPGASRHLVPLLAQHPRQLLTRGPDSARPGEASGIPRVSPPRHACPCPTMRVPAPPRVSLPRVPPPRVPPPRQGHVALRGRSRAPRAAKEGSALRSQRGSPGGGSRQGKPGKNPSAGKNSPFQLRCGCCRNNL